MNGGGTHCGVILVIVSFKTYFSSYLNRIEEIPVCPVFSVWACGRYCGFKDHEDERAGLCYI
jgi:hypothetical protein